MVHRRRRSRRGLAIKGERFRLAVLVVDALDVEFQGQFEGVGRLVIEQREFIARSTALLVCNAMRERGGENGGIEMIPGQTYRC